MVTSLRSGASVALAACLLSGFGFTQETQTELESRPEITVKRTEDFEFTDIDSENAWKSAEWVSVTRRDDAKHNYDTRFKTLYSKTGIYFLIDGTDARLTASLQNDFQNLWLEDVFEVFLWTDEEHPIYFEYEISPLGKELPILVPNIDGKYMGWRPWLYGEDRKTRKRITINGGEQKSGATIAGWSAEIFIPYALLKTLKNVPPTSGMKWQANVYRMDYDNKQHSIWNWSRVGSDFHEYRKFGTLVFE